MELVDRLARHMGRDPGRAPRRGEGGSRRLSPVAFGPARLSVAGHGRPVHPCPPWGWSSFGQGSFVNTGAN